MTDSAGVTDYVRQGVNACLVPPHDPEQLANSILRLIENPAELDCLSAAGLEFARARCMEQNVVDYMTQAFDSLGCRA